MNRITLTAFCVALLACLGLGAALWWQSAAVDDLAAENGRLERGMMAKKLEADQARVAADVAAARAGLAIQMNAAASAKIEAIRNLKLEECADAPLNPDLADIIGRRNVPAEY